MQPPRFPPSSSLDSSSPLFLRPSSLSPIYLDYNASTPIDPRVVRVMRNHLRHGLCGNPSSAHRYGKEAKEAITVARSQVAQCLECEPSQLIFTSGATESLNLVLKGASMYQKDREVGHRIIISAVEHPAVYEITNFLKEGGRFEILICPVTCDGIVDVECFKRLVKSGSIALISIIHANAEIGSIQPIDQLIKISKEFCPDALFHVDASQTVGKIPVSVSSLQPDFMTVAGHKLYGPKGIGVLYVRNRLQLVSQIHGSGQEMSLRGGTENVLLIAAFGEACRLIVLYWNRHRQDEAETNDSNRSVIPITAALNPVPITPSLSFDSLMPARNNDGKQQQEIISYDLHLKHGPSHQRHLLELLYRELTQFLALMKEDAHRYYRVNGPPLVLNSHSVKDREDKGRRLPNTLSISFRGLRGPEIVARCTEVAFSSGSACHSDEGTNISRVLTACGIPTEYGLGTIRLTTGRFSTATEMKASAYIIARTIGELYGWVGVVVPPTTQTPAITPEGGSSFVKEDECYRPRPWGVDW